MYVVPSVIRVACLVADVDDPRVLVPEIAFEHALVVALLDVGFFVGRSRIGGHVGDPRTVGAHEYEPDAPLRVGQLPRFAAVGAHQVDLRRGFRAAARRDEADVTCRRATTAAALSPRSPNVICRAGARRRSPLSRCACALPSVLIGLPLPHGVEHLAAVGRHGRRLPAL